MFHWRAEIWSVTAFFMDLFCIRQTWLSAWYSSRCQTILNIFPLGRGYLPEPFRQIRSYLPEPFRHLRSYLPEPFRHLRSYLPEPFRQIRSYLPEPQLHCIFPFPRPYQKKKILLYLSVKIYHQNNSMFHFYSSSSCRITHKKKVHIGIPANSFLFAGRVPANNFLFAGRVPANNFLFSGRVPANNFLFAGRVPANNLFLLFTNIDTDTG